MKTKKFFWALSLVLAVGLWTSPLRSEEAPEEAPPPVDQAAEEGPGEPPSADAGDATAAPAESQVQYNPDGADETPATQPNKKVRAQTPPAKAQPRVVEEEAAPAVAEQHAGAEPETNKNLREDAIFDRVKALAKRFDAQERKGTDYPSPVVQSAIRAEFMRRTEGGAGPAWMKKRTRDADKAIALDNMELLLTFAEKLSWFGKKGGPKELLEAKLLAVKAVVDKYNYRRGTEGNNNHTTFASTKGLSAAGKIELGRRRTLGAGLIAGDDYTPMTSKKYDDFTKKYRQALTSAVVDFEKLARLIGGGAPAPAASGKQAVATTKEKKVERKPASKAAPEKATKKKRRRSSED